MPEATFDPARELDLYLRIARNGSITIGFKDSNGANYDISGFDFEFRVKEKDQSRTVKILLTENDFISKEGSPASALVISVDDEITNIRESVYYYELVNITTLKTWLCGNLTAHNGRFDGVNEENTLTISDGDTIEVTINEVGGVTIGGDVAYESNGDIKVFKNTSREIELGEELLEVISTGIYQWDSPGFEILTATTVEVKAGNGHVVLNVDDDKDNWEYIDIEWGAQIKTIPTDGNSFIYIDQTGTAQVTTTLPTRTQRKQNLFLGRVVRISGTLANVIPYPDVALYPANQVHEVFDIFGIINNGVSFSAAGANLNLNRNGSGFIALKGINFINSKYDFNQIAVPSASPVTFAYRTQNSALILADRTTVDPANYDVGGVVTAISGASNRATLQRIYQFPPTDAVPNGNVRILYGQVVYNSLAEAIQGLATETFTINPLVPGNGVLVGVLAVTKGCTALNNAATARYIPASRFGEVAIGGAALSTTTLQQAYDNSSTGSITLASGKPLVIYDTNGTTVKERIGFPLVQASTATLTPDLSLYNEFEITAQAAALLIANPTGVISNFSSFIIRVTDNGTARALSYGAKYRAFGSALPTTTTIGKTLYIVCFYNSTDDVYDTVTREEV